MRTRDLQRHTALTGALLLGLLAWDASGLDMRLAAWFGGAHGFALSEHWLLTSVLHEGGRVLSWLFAVALTLSVWWPLGPMRRLALRERAQLIVGTLAS